MPNPSIVNWSYFGLILTVLLLNWPHKKWRNNINNPRSSKTKMGFCSWIKMNQTIDGVFFDASPTRWAWSWSRRISCGLGRNGCWWNGCFGSPACSLKKHLIHRSCGWMFICLKPTRRWHVSDRQGVFPRLQLSICGFLCHVYNQQVFMCVLRVNHRRNKKKKHAFCSSRRLCVASWACCKSLPFRLGQ